MLKILKRNLNILTNVKNSISESLNKTQQIPTFQLISLDGEEYYGQNPVDSDTLQILKKALIKANENTVIDDFLQKAQRQGRISFYMTSKGEEAIMYGTAAALQFEDVIFPQYRELGPLIWRGFTIKQITDSCVGNKNDPNQGHQMPIHYTAPELNYFSVSSTLATQIPQASGFGYGLRMENAEKISVTYFGEGASSEGDFYTGVNFAATLRSQTLFICRNNGYAISTPMREQTVADGILPKAIGLGVEALRVDGNDFLAVMEATKYARNYILKEKKPFFIEFKTYRIGDHSTSDHSILYRSQEEIDDVKKNNNPITRLTNFLKKQKILDENWDEFIEQKKKEVEKEVISNLKLSLSEKLPGLHTLFDNVYKEKPQSLINQEKFLNEHIQKNIDKYDLSKYDNQF